MKYEDFLKIIETELEIRARFLADNKRGKNLPEQPRAIGEKYTTGGMTGGSCWGTSADRSVTAEEAPELTELDAILARFAPEISYLKYRELASSVIVHDTDFSSCSEYYGNYTTYGAKYVVLVTLHKKLEEMGFLND